MTHLSTTKTIKQTNRVSITNNHTSL